jgi:hypothetical protein
VSVFDPGSPLAAGVFFWGSRYAYVTSRREDNRRMSNDEQVGRVAGLAVEARKSVDFTGYWQSTAQAFPPAASSGALRRFKRGSF